VHERSERALGVAPQPAEGRGRGGRHAASIPNNPPSSSRSAVAVGASRRSGR
jgi:hypothetical protein